MPQVNKGGRPPAPPGMRRVNVPLRLPEWLVQWMAEQPETPAELIEAALLKAHKLRAAGWVKVKTLEARKSWAESSVALKDKRDPVGNGGVPRVLWECRIHGA